MNLEINLGYSRIFICGGEDILKEARSMITFVSDDFLIGDFLDCNGVSGLQWGYFLVWLLQ